jgi:ribonuclease P protein component
MEQQTRNTLPKKERLCGKTSISMLLAKGKFSNVPGMRFIFRKETGNDVDRIMVSVPKKLFKRAVKRNLLKRRIRESYRKQKHNLTIEGGLDVLFTYNTKEVMTYGQIYEAVGQIIEKINKSTKSKVNEPESEQN